MAATPHDPAVVRMLTERIRAGDADAFERVYRAWYARVVGLARACTRRDESFCLDIAQDVMLRAARSIPVLPDERALGAWFGRCTLSACVDALRRDARRARRERAAAMPGGTHAAAPAGDHDDGEWLRRWCGGLDMTDFDLLHAAVVRGATLREAGLASGVSEGAATGRVRRAMARLRDAARRRML
ncbi:MAG: sigma factor [Planctomycetota bacterium]|nr:sigma factor [Planctomycetota bacterium]